MLSTNSGRLDRSMPLQWYLGLLFSVTPSSKNSFRGCPSLIGPRGEAPRDNDKPLVGGPTGAIAGPGFTPFVGNGHDKRFCGNRCVTKPEHGLSQETHNIYTCKVDATRETGRNSMTDRSTTGGRTTSPERCVI